jgi:hypothetical protein
MSLDVTLLKNVCRCCGRGEEVFTYNVTHNLNKMAEEAGIYMHLWKPDEIGITQAKELIGVLKFGLGLLESDPERFKKLNPANGWGTYQGLVDFVKKYLAACENWPEATIDVSR